MDDPRKKKFKCNLCDKIFTWKRSLNLHMKSHLENEDERLPHECDECRKRFTSSSNLISHKKTHLSKDKRKKFECGVCGK
ncbi:hypothetical protein PMAYCL1PPCAC_08006, partial [Pristionchus mayeri]